MPIIMSIDNNLALLIDNDVIKDRLLKNMMV